MAARRGGDVEPAPVPPPRETGPARRGLRIGPLTDVEDLARLGRFGEAIHLLLLHLFDALQRRPATAPAPAHTGREVLARTRLAADARAALGVLVLAAEGIHFGGRAAVREDYEACLGPLPALPGQLRAGLVSEAPFSRRALVWLISISVASFTTWLVVGLVAPEPADVESAEADAYSRSAIGHRAFVEMMRAQGVPVMVSRFDSGSRAGLQALLIVAEPRLDVDAPARSRKLQQMLRSARRTLLVLPKWQGHEDREHPGWLDRAELAPPTAIARALQDADVPAGTRYPAATAFRPARARSPLPTLRRPQLLRPTGDPRLTPLVTCANGWLLAEREDALGGRLLILSDPDVLSNHGLGDGDNAAVAWSVLGYARQPGQAVVLDETLHGHERVPSLWRELFTFPLAVASVQGALVDRVPGVGRAAPLRRSGSRAARPWRRARACSSRTPRRCSVWAATPRTLSAATWRA